MYDSLSREELVQRLIRSENVKIVALEGDRYFNPNISNHESATSNGCHVIETGEKIEETWRGKVGRFITKGWYGADAEPKHCLKGVQIMDPENQLVYWIRMQSRTVEQIGRKLKDTNDALG